MQTIIFYVNPAHCGSVAGQEGSAIGGHRFGFSAPSPQLTGAQPRVMGPWRRAIWYNIAPYTFTASILRALLPIIPVGTRASYMPFDIPVQAVWRAYQNTTFNPTFLLKAMD